MSNPFLANIFFQYPLKRSENQGLSDVFWGDRKETFGLKWVEIEDCTVSNEKWENGTYFN